MKNTIQFAAKHTDINKNDFEVMLHARQSLLFHSSQPWFKRESNTFDVKREPAMVPKFVNLRGYS